MSNDNKNEISLEPQMQKLADVLGRYAPDGWKDIYVKYRADESLTEIDTWVVVDREKHPLDIQDEDIDCLENTFDEICQITVTPWKEATFELTAEGYCKINFTYE